MICFVDDCSSVGVTCADCASEGVCVCADRERQREREREREREISEYGRTSVAEMRRAMCTGENSRGCMRPAAAVTSASASSVLQ